MAEGRVGEGWMGEEVESEEEEERVVVGRVVVVGSGVSETVERLEKGSGKREGGVGEEERRAEVREREPKGSSKTAEGRHSLKC